MINSALEKRTKNLNNKKWRKGDFVLYWMQSSHRVENNWALTYAANQANKTDLPLVVFFGLSQDFAEANYRHYWFMLEGLREVSEKLENRKTKFVVKVGSPAKNLVELSKEAALVVVDKAYLKTNLSWYKYAAENCEAGLIQVEDNVVVPVEEASSKEEYSAATLRPKILSKLNYFLELPTAVALNRSSLNLEIDTINIDELEDVLSTIKVDKTVDKSPFFRGGTSQANKNLEDFYQNDFVEYEKTGNNPENGLNSNLSPYLHFGQISPIYIALKMLRTNQLEKHRFLEQLIIRRELAINFVYYNNKYDSFSGLPDWAQKNLTEHLDDKREFVYSLKEFEEGSTHDKYWNAAQKEMVKTGKMNGYMRMYWGKKIIEWTKTPMEAFEWALYLNNKYELDGRDPNGYTGVAWCFGKHDRPWSKRSIFGNVRYMNDKGLERKFEMKKYLDRVKLLV
ncbi:MAG: deoxyribodipyrimidine photo-lyase [Candidatus Bathyarchaeia archaeon]